MDDAPNQPVVAVLIADDQALVRAGFRSILDARPGLRVVGEAANGREAIDLVRRHRPDVVLMDIEMPGVNGLEATRRIVSEAPPEHPVAVLMLTTFDLDAYVYDALRAGASGFLLKDVPPEELIAPAITRRLIERFVATAPPTGVAPGLANLTPREREVLELVARGRSNGEIADDLVLSEATVKTHVKRVLAKLGVRDRVQAVVLAYESGVVTPGDDPKMPPRGDDRPGGAR
jgi:DNA-binding NarL/FixJ family response regulator